MENNYLKGRGAQYNPRNKFHSNYYERTDPDGIDDFTANKPKTTVFYEYPKSIISRNESPDLKLINSLNPYQGCEHGCVYCFARNTHEFWGFGAGVDFESKIIVKKNVAELLEREIISKTWKVHPIMLSGNTDCYQPLEKKYKLTRSVLKLMLKYQHPVSVITKNILIKRDLDIIRELADNNLIHIYFSITTLNESLRRIMEPRTATIKSKFELIELLVNEGIPVGIMVAPIIPGLNHFEIPAILERAGNIGVKKAGYTVLRLNGAIGEMMKDWLSKNYPLKTDKVWNQIKTLHDGKVNDSKWGRRIKGSGKIAEIINDLFDVSLKKHFNDREMPPLNIHSFRKSGNMTLF